MNLSTNIAIKFGLIGLTVFSLVASSIPGLTPQNTDLGIGILPNETISENSAYIRISSDGKWVSYDANVDAKNTARATSQYFDQATGLWTRISGHTLRLSAAAQATGTRRISDNEIIITKLDFGKGNTSKISLVLQSATGITNIELDAKDMNGFELAAINLVINTAITQFYNDLITVQQLYDLIQPTLQASGFTLPTNSASLLTDIIVKSGIAAGHALPLNYSGAGFDDLGNSIELDDVNLSSASNGIYGGYALQLPHGKQFTAFYAKEAGSELVGTGTNTTHKVDFAGAKKIDGELATLHGRGIVEVDFSAGILKTNEAGIVMDDNDDKLTFNLSLDAADNLFKSNAATYETDGADSVTLTGNAEAGVFKKDGTESVLGAADFRDGEDVVVGGFGSSPINNTLITIKE